MVRIVAFRSYSSSGDAMLLSRIRMLGTALWRSGADSATSQLFSEHPAGHCIEPAQKVRVAGLRRRDQCRVERPVGTDRARLVLAREVAREPRNQPLRLLGVGI